MFVALLIASLLAGCGGEGKFMNERSLDARVRCEGVYVDVVPEIINEKEFHHYLRFYADSHAIPATNSASPEAMQAWLTRESEKYPPAVTKVNGDSLSFTTKHWGGTIDYEFAIMEGKLQGTVSSNITGRKAERTYVFVPWESDDGE